MKHLAVLVLGLAACNGDVLTLRYHLEGVEPAGIAGVETTIVPVDPERFAAPTDIVTIDAETRYRVGCGAEDCTGQALVLLVDRKPPAGGQLPSEFTLQFRSGASSPTHLIISATAPGVGAPPGAEAVARSLPIETAFSGASIDLYIRPKTLCGGGDCQLGQACCDGRCIDVSADAQNCGDCGTRCAAGEACTDGTCRCAGGPSCPKGASCCDDGCVDTSADQSNCGGCGALCGNAETCGAPPSAPGTCSCGTRGTSCGTSERCCGDSSQCVAKATVCSCGGLPCPLLTESCCGDRCIDLDRDELNCGRCAHVCPIVPTMTASPLCVGGHCQCNDADCDEDCCPSGCTDTKTDARNCGGCGISCDAGEDCIGGVCSCKGGAGCGLGKTCCGIGACVDTTNDGSNCGGCGQLCLAGQSCIAGTCQAAGCNPPCTDGSTCEGGVCMCGAAPCAAPNGCCNGACVALDTHMNCGACGAKCGTGETCKASPTSLGGQACSCNGGAACTSPAVCCASGCADLSKSKLNCGQCDATCAAGEKCTLSRCRCGTTKIAAAGTGGYCDVETEFCNTAPSPAVCAQIGVHACPLATGYDTATDCAPAPVGTGVCCGFCPTGDTFRCGAKAGDCPASCGTVFIP